MGNPRHARKYPMQELEELMTSLSDDSVVVQSELFSTLYEDLKRIAIGQMKREQAGHTLQSTALVHEAFLKLLKINGCRWQNRRHFFASASEVMRRILIDHARTKHRVKRGGKGNRVSLDSSLATIRNSMVSNSSSQTMVLCLNQALNELEQLAPMQAKVVELRFFAKLTHRQIADILEISASTVDRYWAFSKAWLLQKMRSEQER